MSALRRLDHSDVLKPLITESAESNSNGLDASVVEGEETTAVGSALRSRPVLDGATAEELDPEPPPETELELGVGLGAGAGVGEGLGVGLGLGVGVGAGVGEGLGVGVDGSDPVMVKSICCLVIPPKSSLIETKKLSVPAKSSSAR